KYKLTSKMDISELGQYTSEFLENLTDDRKRNQARRSLRDGFKFSSEQVSILIPNQRSGKTKTINLATSNRYQNPISIPQGLKEETIREMAHRFLQNELSIRDIRAEAYALALSALHANAGSSRLSRLRRELRNLGASSQIIEATKFPDITKDANEIQKNRRIFVE
ncbi:5556_t:CDS:1, partial [Gigaspora rosea]